MQAKLFEGATHVREYQAKPAVEAFKEVLAHRRGEHRPASIKPFEDLANLSLARTFYSTGQYELATKYFDRVSQESYDWPNSLFESSWANFMLKQQGYSKALGNIHTIQAPFFENYIKPESIGRGLTVKATIYFYNCLYDRAQEAIDEFNAVYPDVFTELKKLIAGTSDNGQLFDLAVKIRKETSGPARAGRARGARRPRRPSLLKRFEYVEELDRELKASTTRPTPPGSRPASRRRCSPTSRCSARWRSTRRAIWRGAASSASRRSCRSSSSASSRSSSKFCRARRASSSRRSSQEQQIAWRPAPATSRVDDIRADDEHVIWPFIGEYWRDELGYYRVKIANKCQKNAPEGAPSTGETPAPARARPAGGGGGGAAAEGGGAPTP